MGKCKNLSGQRFGRLTVIERSGSRGEKPLWKCQCDCGNITYVISYSLTSGATRSCGCIRKNSNHTPRKKDRLYVIWSGMKGRCYNAGNSSSKWYLEKGITVCEEWKNNFSAFKEWALDNGYDYSKSRKEQQIDRIDNSKGYSPDNCRFVSSAENSRNKSDNVFLSYKGETLIIADWAKKLNLSERMLQERAKRMTDPEKILFTEKNTRSNTGIKGIYWIKSIERFILQIDGEYLGCFKTVGEAMRKKEEYKNGARRKQLL